MTIARRLRAAIRAVFALVLPVAATREGAHPVEEHRAWMRPDRRDGGRRDDGWHGRLAAMRTAGLALAALLGLTAWPGGEAAAQALDFAVRAGGVSSDGGSVVAVDSAGGSWVTGNFEDDATFGAGEANETTLTSASADFLDVFVARYNADGTLDFEDVFVARYSADGTLDFAVQAAGSVHRDRVALSATAISTATACSTMAISACRRRRAGWSMRPAARSPTCAPASRTGPAAGPIWPA